MGDETSWSRLRSELYSLVGRNPRSNRRIAEVAELAPDSVVLDVGCGPGAAVRAAATTVARAVGVDRSDAMIAIARRRSTEWDNVEYVVAGAEELPFADASFDRVWTIHAFHHWEDRDAGIGECFRVLRPGGRLMIIESETKGGHGLSRDAADSLATDLVDRGFAEAVVSKPHRQLIVTATRG